jgi:coat protein Gp5
MANTFLTNQVITYDALDVLENTYGVSKRINKEYSDQFRFGGAVLGQTLSIRKPPRYIGRLGQAVQIEGNTETFVPLTLSYQRGVDTQVSSQDLVLSIDNYRQRFLKPQVVRVSNLIDQDVCGLAQGLSQSVGVPGTTPTALSTYLAAKTKLDNLAAPMDGDRHMFLNPAAEASIVDNLKGLFQASDEIKRQYLEGTMGRAIGFAWEMDQNIYVHTVGTLGGTPTVTTAPANGATSIVTGSWSSTTLNAGDVVSFVSTTTPVNSVNPQSYQSTGQAAQFVVTATVTDAAGAITIPVAPAFISSGQLQNITNAPASSTPVYVFDTPAASFASISAKQAPQNIACHKDFGTLAMVDMPLPGGTDKAYRAASKITGYSIRVIRDYVATSDQWIQRLDCLYGVAVLRQELGVRVQGGA